MHRNVRRYATAYIEAAEHAKAAEVPDIARRFIAALTRRRQRRLLPKVLASLSSIWNDRHGITAVRVTTASKVDVTALERALGDVELSTAVDSAIIGGAIVDRGDTRIDGSVRSSLNRLRSALVRKE